MYPSIKKSTFEKNFKITYSTHYVFKMNRPICEYHISKHKFLTIKYFVTKESCLRLTHCLNFLCVSHFHCSPYPFLFFVHFYSSKSPIQPLHCYVIMLNQAKIQPLGNLEATNPSPNLEVMLSSETWPSGCHPTGVHSLQQIKSMSLKGFNEAEDSC